MISALTLDHIIRIPQEPPYRRRWREDATTLEQATPVIRDHWDSLPYNIRVGLAALPSEFEAANPRPRHLFAWLAAMAKAPVVAAMYFIRGDDVYLRWAMAYANLVVAIKSHTTLDAERDAKAWKLAIESDPGLLTAHARGRAAVQRREFFEADWTTLRKATDSDTLLTNPTKKQID